MVGGRLGRGRQGPRTPPKRPGRGARGVWPGRPDRRAGAVPGRAAAAARGGPGPAPAPARPAHRQAGRRPRAPGARARAGRPSTRRPRPAVRWQSAPSRRSGRGSIRVARADPVGGLRHDQPPDPVADHPGHGSRAVRHGGQAVAFDGERARRGGEPDLGMSAAPTPARRGFDGRPSRREPTGTCRPRRSGPPRPPTLRSSSAVPRRGRSHRRRSRDRPRTHASRRAGHRV